MQVAKGKPNARSASMARRLKGRESLGYDPKRVELILARLKPCESRVEGRNR